MIKYKFRDGEMDVVLTVGLSHDDRVGVYVGLCLAANDGPYRHMHGISYTSYKMAEDEHDPVFALKNGLRNVLKEMDVNKEKRTLVWDKMRSEFPIGEYFLIYHAAYMK